ncbi:Transcription initiation factor TFIID subunit 5, partial [Quaeritorhiza haematococci]
MDTYKSDHTEHHASDLARFSSLSDPQHLRENDLVKSYRQAKFVVPMSRYSFELLLAFLQDNKLMGLLRILNRSVRIQ